jgi:hypothetical protein
MSTRTTVTIVFLLICSTALAVYPATVAAVVVTIFCIFALVGFVVAAGSDYYLHYFLDWYDSQMPPVTPPTRRSTSVKLRKKAKKP